MKGVSIYAFNKLFLHPARDNSLCLGMEISNASNLSGTVYLIVKDSIVDDLREIIRGRHLVGIGGCS